MHYRTISLVLLCLCATALTAQKKKVVYLDTLGNAIDIMESISIRNTGRYALIVDESNEKTRYIKWRKTTEKEYDSLVEKTRSRSILTKKIGTDFKHADVVDINGKSYTAAELNGKVVVINFWFVGCGPCEVEMPELNKMHARYKDNQDVVFISFAKSSEAKVRKFLLKKPFAYPVIEMSKEQIAKFQIPAYPTNYVIGKDGKYQYASQGIGPGSVKLIDAEIELAAKK